MNLNGSESKPTGDSVVQRDTVNPRRQLSVASRLTLMTTSVLFWVVGNTLPDSEWLLRELAKLVSVLSFLNYATWTGTRHAIGVLDFVAVHASVLIFLFRLSGKSPAFLVNLVGVVATFVAWRNKSVASDQILVHFIALFNLWMFGFLSSKA